MKFHVIAQALLDKYTCPKCNNGNLSVFFSPCYDNECCGLLDHITCSNCSFEIEGYFNELELFVEQLLNL